MQLNDTVAWHHSFSNRLLPSRVVSLSMYISPSYSEDCDQWSLLVCLCMLFVCLSARLYTSFVFFSTCRFACLTVRSVFLTICLIITRPVAPISSHHLLSMHLSSHSHLPAFREICLPSSDPDSGSKGFRVPYASDCKGRPWM